MFSVPQFIDVEDKIVGPLTWKQLLWMIGMAGALLIVFSLFDTTLSIIIAIPVVLIFCLMAFYQPSGLPMTTFLGSATMFVFRPKVAVWERPAMALPTVKAPANQQAPTQAPIEKELTREKLAELARLIDQR